ncbi:MAG TPA: hypothetical protein VKV03_18615 [Candidatus Binataceae bacterium]|nr:hypothetical protein [Candidatus Binataceae bacterium]
MERLIDRCQHELDDGKICGEELIGKDEPAIHHAEGAETKGPYSHHSCRLGHAWHRHMGNGLITPCDCTGHARSAV